DANVLCLGGRTTELRAAQAIVKIWLATQASTESRHKRRVKEISTIEEFC
ncbi:TPA: hypothetical protein HA270_03995, partial [Candidatus Woesearchaeota archaeon]|nr:hypothetical protein [Candidatus Woesearchaeota archaeon]